MNAHKKINTVSFLIDLFLMLSFFIFLLVIGDINFFIRNFNYNYSDAFDVLLMTSFFFIVISVIGTVRVNRFNYYIQYKTQAEDVHLDNYDEFFKRALYSNATMTSNMIESISGDFGKGWSTKGNLEKTFNAIKKSGSSESICKFHYILSEFDNKVISSFMRSVNILSKREFNLNNINKKMDEFLLKK